MKNPRRSDIGFLDLDPQAGNEQAKRRPVLVISDTKFNALGLAVVVPITSTEPRHAFHLPLPSSLKTTGSVMTEQIKSLDWKARKFEFVEKAPNTFTIQIRQLIKKFL